MRTERSKSRSRRRRDGRLRGLKRRRGERGRARSRALRQRGGRGRIGIHDPTTLNRQGPDRGTQYRSIILYGDDKQKEIAEHSKLEAQRFWEDPIVTEIVPLKEYFKAEDYHQNYFETHPEMSYCQIIINPKLKHFKETFKQFLKEEYAA